MAKFLFGTVPIGGHVQPGLCIARALVKRGHEVWWYTGRRFQERVEATGARFVPMQAAIDYDDRNLEASFPARRGLKGLAQLKWDLKHVFVDSGIGQLQDIMQILREFPADVLVSDSGFFGAAAASEKGGWPWAVFSISALTCSSRDTAPFGLAMAPGTSRLVQARNRTLNWVFDQLIFRDVTAHTNRIRQGLALPPITAGIFDVAVSPFLYLLGTTAAFEYPRSDLPASIHYVGPFLSDAPTDFVPPEWWDDLSGDRPVVHVTQGTVATSAGDLILPTLRALAGEELLVVVTTGGQPIDSIPPEALPDNARVAEFIPHHRLLPHVDVMVTNGGYNGVQIALAHGVPLVAAGQTEEKPEICARIAWSGAGINLRARSPSPERIRAAVRQILADPQYRHKAQQLQADYARHHAPTLSAQLLEQLADTQQPVLRSAMA